MDDNIAKYMIPLDELGLSFLSHGNSIRKKTEHQPLWNKANFDLKDKKIYYSNEGSDDMDDTNTHDDYSDSSCAEVEFDTKTCFICNIEVPEVYMNKHVNSYKHEMFLTIANVAIERAKKQVTEIDCETNDKNNRGLYFCETCVSVTTVQKKSDHLETKSHKNAVKKERILQDLIHVYNNISEEFDFDEEYLLEYKTHSKSNQLDESMKDDDVYEKDGSIESNLNSNVNEPKSDKESDAENEFELPKDNAHAEICKEITYNIKSVDNDYVIIEIDSDCALKIKVDYYHGIMLMTKNRYKCLICSDTFKKKHKHINSNKHNDKISLPIKDRNCIRKLNSAKSHCIICNQLIDDGDKHIGNDEHEDQLKYSMIMPEGDEEVGSSKIEESKIDVGEDKFTLRVKKKK